MAGALVKLKSVCVLGLPRESGGRGGRGQSAWVNRHSGLLAGQTP